MASVFEQTHHPKLMQETAAARRGADDASHQTQLQAAHHAIGARLGARQLGATLGTRATNGALKTSPAQLESELLVQRRRIERGGPSDLRPVVRLDFAHNVSPALRRCGNNAIVRSRAFAQVKVARPQEWVHRSALAATHDARVRNLRRIGNFAVEGEHPLAGQIDKCLDIDQSPEKEPKAAQNARPEVCERGAQVRSPDRRQRGHSVSQAELADCVAGVEPTHAVRNQIHLSGRQRANRRRQLLRAEYHRADRRHARSMHLDAHRPKPFGNASEVNVAPSSELDLVEAKSPMGEHNWIAQPWLAAKAAKAKPSPQPSDDESHASREERERGASGPRHSREV